MDRIYMQKYGFKRCKEMDYDDEGNHFEMWMAGDLPVSKRVKYGIVYLCPHPCRLENNGGYFTYRNVPGYKELERYNGCFKNVLTDEMLQQFYEDCIKFQEELKNYIAGLKLPTREELEAKLDELNAALEKAKTRISNAFGDSDKLLVLNSMNKWDRELVSVRCDTICRRIRDKSFMLEVFLGNPSSVHFMEEKPFDWENDYLTQEAILKIRNFREGRYFAERSLDGKGYLFDKEFSLRNPIAVEKDYETACRQADKFNAEEE